MFNNTKSYSTFGEKMIQDEYNNSNGSNVPSYVSVYNSLYSDIMSNVYMETELLPGETNLSKKYGVSRNTLRQALAILSEDGLIIKVQGKGTIVAKRTETQFIKNKINPMVQLAVEEIDLIENDYNFNPPTDIARQKLELSANDIVLASNNIFKTEDKVIGFSFIQVPTMMFDTFGVDAGNRDDIEKLLNTTIFENTSKSNMSIKLIYANEIEVKYLEVELNTPLLLIETILYNVGLRPFARCKFYFKPEHYKLTFQT